MLAQALILFQEGATARQRVAGLPAAARAVREAAEAGFSHCVLSVGDGWGPDSVLLAEVDRLRGAMTAEFALESDALPRAGADTLLIAGEALVPAEHLRLARAGQAITGTGAIEDAEQLRDGGGSAALKAAARRIVAETAKPGDGIVSRHINRPMSQAISRFLLRYDGIRPIHGTWGTGLIALVMVASLLSGTQAGLVAGAVLFQLASMFDGVDGEIARATYRTSPEGARLDSLIDAATNVCCIGGVALNLYMQGETRAALAGGLGMAVLATGLAVIGRRSRSNPSGLNFNAVKDHFSQRRSLVMQWLTWLTMRDSFALLGAGLVVAGFAAQAMYALAVVSTGWLVVVLTVMRRRMA